MKLIMPDYCGNFRCIAEKCSDNCCIGWGIGIDDKTAELYKSVGGDFGKRLEKNIDPQEQCFINGTDKRCPFLNERNLCDIIITLGEESLCDICDRHPRYFEWFDDAIEGGIGLCCEEAARLVLGSNGFVTTVSEAPERLCCDDDEEPCDELYYAFLKEARENIMELLLDESLPLSETLERLGAYAELLQELTDEYEIYEVPAVKDEREKFDMEKAVELMLSAEPIDDEQTGYVRRLERYASENGYISCVPAESEKELRNIAVYFVWRYFLKAVFSGDVCSKLMLAVFAAEVTGLMFEYEASGKSGLTFEEKCMIAKRFSKMIEYSEENLGLVTEAYNY